MARPPTPIRRTHRQQKWVKFTDESQVHEIPPKPKRTRKAVEKRSCSAPNLDELKKQPNGKIPSEVQADAVVESVDQGQRVSMTSLEDLKKFDATKNLPPREKADLNQVTHSDLFSQSAFCTP